MFDHKETLGHVSSHLSRALGNAMREALTPLGLLPAQFTALAEIAQAEGLTQKDLVARLDLEQPGVARTLAGLEGFGWIERRTLSGRLQGLYLTDRARQALPRALEIAQALDAEAMASLSRTERALLLDTLEQLIGTGRPG